MATSPFDKTQASGDQYATLKREVVEQSSSQHLIPGFDILSELGRGAFGVVYLARDQKLDRKVAIKVPLFDDPKSRDQYVKEAQHAAKLDISGIVPVYQVGTLSSGQPFVVQKYIEGHTLRHEMKDGARLPMRRACSLMAEIAGVVAVAHEREMVHRDLKPDNILIDATGKPWVADFGLAISEKDQREHRGERAGTPVYMAPEQFLGRADWLDGRTDIYSMGVMLYEMLVGRVPFEAQSLAELEEQVLHRDPKPISQRAPHIPVGFDTIFQNCCAKQVNDRYANAYELAADLEAILPELPEEAPTSGYGGSARITSGLTRKSKRQAGRSTKRSLRGATIRQETTAKKSRYVLPLSLSAVAGLISVALLISSAMKSGEPDPIPNGNGSSAVNTGGANADASDAPEIVAAVIPAAASTTKNGSGTTNGVKPIAAGAASADTSVPAIPESTPGSSLSPIPERPFRVAKDGSGTHTTIAAALAMADEGETIQIKPAIYNENLTISRAVQLVGDGNRDDIIVNGQKDSAIKIRDHAQVRLQNLTVQGELPGKEPFNVVELESGALTVLDCSLVSNSWNCVLAKKGCELSANKCKFASKDHPGVYIAEGAKFDIGHCDFLIRNQVQDGETVPYALEIKNTPGSVRQSTFYGHQKATGICVLNAAKLVTIENCTVQDCDTGMLVHDCANVVISGEGEIADIKGCNRGIHVIDSAVKISAIECEGRGVGILAGGSKDSSTSVVEITDCNITGYNQCVLGEQMANIVMRRVHTDSGDVGVSLQTGANVTLIDCQLTSHINEGASVDQHTGSIGLKADDATAILNGCTVNGQFVGISVRKESDLTITDCQVMENVVGLQVMSGKARANAGVFGSNMVAVSTSLADVVQDTGEPYRDPIELGFQQTVFRGSKSTTFSLLLPCSLRMAKCSFLGPKDSEVPKLGKKLEKLNDGDTVVVQWEKPQG